jgi:hypothetical protein
MRKTFYLFPEPPPGAAWFKALFFDVTAEKADHLCSTS